MISLLFLDLQGCLRSIVPLLSPLLPPLPIVTVDVAVLAHPVRVELVVLAVPGLLVSSEFVVAVAAHSLGVVLAVGVSAAVRLFAE